MARMHSRKRGKSKSTKPLEKSNPSWIRYKSKEIEMIVIKLAKEGKTASEIGLILRDLYAIPDFKSFIGKSLSVFLKENELSSEIPEDLNFLIKRSILLNKHLEKNHKDKTAVRGLQLTNSKIQRLVKYYKKSKYLPQDWKFDPDRIRLYID